PVKIPLHNLLNAHRTVMGDELTRTSKMEQIGIKMAATVTDSAPVLQFVEKVDHAGSAMMATQKERTVQILYNHGGYLTKAPAIAKNWTDYRDLPRPPKAKDGFREWFKRHKAEKGGK